jgi:hypothetical protein
MKEKFKTAVKYAGIGMTVASLALLGGCSSDDDGGGAGLPNKIVVSDPYGINCTVTVGNSSATATSTAGVYETSAPLNGNTQVLAVGCTDSSTGMDLPDMKSDGDGNVDGEITVENVSPITTAVEILVANGETPDEAENKVAAMLGVDKALLHDDPVSNVSLQKAAAKITSTLQMIKDVTDNAVTTDSGITDSQKNDIVTKSFTNLIIAGANSGNLDTTVADSVEVTAALTDATTEIAVDNPTIAQAINNKGSDIAVAAGVISTEINAIDNVSATAITEVATVAKAVKDDISAQVVQGNTTTLAADLTSAVVVAAAAIVTVVVVDPTPPTTTGGGGTGN